MISVFVCGGASSVDSLSDLIENVFSDLTLEVEIKQFASHAECLGAVRGRAGPPDVAFLEIDMSGANGFDLAREIKKERTDALVVFVSDRHELVFDCFDCHPFSFVRKSGDELFCRELERTCRDIADHFKRKKIVEIRNVYTGTEYVPADDILFCKKDDHYLVWSLTEKKKTIKERGTIRSAIGRHETVRFIRPHVSYLVNASHIKVFSTKFRNIILDSGDKIPVSRSMKDSAFSEYAEYLKTH